MNKTMMNKQLGNKKIMEVMLIKKHIILTIMVVVIFLGLFAVKGKAVSDFNKEQKYKYYTQIRIEYGDTLWSIANQYMDQDYDTRASYIAEVKSINHIKEDSIQEGKKLIIPYYSSELKE